MARVVKHFDSCEAYAAATDLTGVYTAVGSVSVVSDGALARTGTQSIHLTGADSGTGGGRLEFDVALGDRCSIGQAVFMGSGFGTTRLVMQLNTGGSVKAIVLVNQDGNSFQLRIGGSVVATSGDNAWTGGLAYVEVEYYSHASEGFFVLYLDSVEVLRFQGDTVGAAGSVDQVIFRGWMRTGTSNASHHSDFYFVECTGTEGINQCRLRPPTFVFGTPTSDVVADGTPSTGTDNFELIDELPNDGDTSHITLENWNDVDVYGVNWGTFPGEQEPLAVRVHATGRRPDAGDTDMRVLLDDDGSRSFGDPVVPEETDYSSVSTTWPKNPDGDIDWTEAAVTDQRIGVQSVERS